MKILIMDSNEMRGNALKNIIIKLYSNIIVYRQVNGGDKISDKEINEGWDSIKERSELLIDDNRILFIHHNDNRQPYWREFTELFLLKDDKNLCVSFSGGDTASQINERHCPIEKPINDNADGLWHVNDFLLSIKNNENNPFDKLIGYDKFLEAKLELLHKCLLPSAAPTIAEFQTEFQILKNFEERYNSFLAVINGKSDEDVFHPSYIEAVKQLRIDLLGS